MIEQSATAALDERTFGSVTESLRRDLLLHCYRFTGSVHEAEDLVQETLARAWRGRGQYRAEAGPRTWLRRIATRVCLDALRHAKGRRRLPSSQPAEGEVLWLEPIHDDLIADVDADPAAAYDLRESVSLAFLTALQVLPPRQRAVLILRDVLALSAAETADELETTVPSVNSLLHRARETVRTAYRPAQRPAPTDVKVASLLRRYVRAWESGDVEALLALLKRDAILEMPPIPTAAVGHAAIRGFLSASILDGTTGRWRGVTTEANGGPAIALYQREADGYRFTGLQLLAVDGTAISTITAWMDDSMADRFHLPATIGP
jgi:RNA polymerase sigma-70 factor (ECF subfamily)